MTDLEAVAADGLDLAGILRTEIRRRLEIPGALEELSNRLLNEMAGMVTKLLRAEATVLKEARSLEKDAAEKARKLTHEGKRQVIRAVIADLPAEQVVLLQDELGWSAAPR